MSAPTFDAIVAGGTHSPDGARVSPNWIRCADGFEISVIAGPGCYCRPRPALLDFGPTPNFMAEVAKDYSGPYSEVEVGYPSARPEPWHCSPWSDGYDRHADHEVCDGWQVQCDDAADDAEDGWSTVYSYVPVEMVRALLESHGGEISAGMSPAVSLATQRAARS